MDDLLLKCKQFFRRWPLFRQVKQYCLFLPATTSSFTFTSLLAFLPVATSSCTFFRDPSVSQALHDGPGTNSGKFTFGPSENSNLIFSHYNLLHNDYFLLHDDSDACDFQSVISLIPLHSLILVTDSGSYSAPFGQSHFGLNTLVALIWIPGLLSALATEPLMASTACDGGALACLSACFDTPPSAATNWN
jgi:hypothetical protein